MKVNTIKIQGALSEIRSSRSNVRHLLKEAFCGEIESIKNSVINKVNTMFEGLEQYLTILANADLAAHHHREDV